MLELLDLTQLIQVTIPERIPLLDLFRRGYMELPVHTYTLAPAQRAKECLYVLIFPLKLAAVEAGKGSIAHDA